jgi:hypothetical protein
MFSDPAISALGFQLELYRWEDHFQKMRDRRAANAADAEISRLCVLNDWLAGRVSHAVQAHNLLLNQAQAYEAECKRRFTQLEARIDQLERQNAELTAAKEKAEAEVIEYAVANVRRILSDPT